MPKMILAIDDDNLVHHIINATLKEVCQVMSAKNAEQGFKVAIENNPDIILLDVEMPGMNGYEVCELLKKDDSTKDIPIMFLSGKSTLSERVKGYNSGGNDYIIKPFEPEELLAKVKVLYEYRNESKNLKNDVVEAQNTAEIAMSDSGDMGRVMRYVGQTYHAHNMESLTDYFFEFFNPLNLQVVVAYWHKNANYFYSNTGNVCPLEQELLENCKQGERFVDFSARTIVNYPHVSLLIKNMPLADIALYGRYKDLFPHILEATNAKVQAMEVNDLVIEQANEITQTFSLLDETLKVQIKNLYNHGQESVNLVNALSKSMNHHVAEFGLTSGQEASILLLIDKTVRELTIHLNINDSIRSAFDDALKYMEHIMVQRETLLEQIQQEENTANEITSQTDIELF